MSVNGLTSTTSVYGATAYEQGKTYTKKTEEASTDSTSTSTSDSEAVTYTSSMSESDRAALIQMLKSDNESRVESFKSMVTDMLNRQGFAVNNSDDIWKLLAKGDYTVDEKTAKEAQEAISEDGEWGVNKTAERLFEFAKAYAGDDEEKMEEMMNAFEEGFKQAEELWGGTLPDISYQTYDKMYELYDAYKQELGTVTNTTVTE